MKKRSKKYQKSVELVEAGKKYDLSKALELMYQMPQAKFDETIEISARLGVDPKQSDQMVRGSVKLPKGSGKKVKVVVFTENPEAALAAGAAEAGLEDLIKKVEGGWFDFDVAIATTSAMKDVRSVARVLGPRGLMPNPKTGTVVEVEKVAEAIEEVKAGRIDFKMDKTANVAIVVGKRSFNAEDIQENANAVIKALNEAKPAASKGDFVKSLSISMTMGPGVALAK